MMNDIEAWIRLHVEPTGDIETVHVRPWATVLRVPTADGPVWFKACAPVQAFEPRLSAALFERWPDRVANVLGHDEQRGWLLLADAGKPIDAFGNPPQTWLAALPQYAELQRAETTHASDHLAHGVPDLRVVTLAAQFEELLAVDLPLEAAEIRRLRQFAPRFARLCNELATCDVRETLQHDDLHHFNLYVHDRDLRVLDWGDASISHPFASLVVTFRFLEERTKLAPNDPWFDKLRDAYLEPWGGRDLRDVFALSMHVGAFARAIAYLRVRAVLSPEERRAFDDDFAIVLRRALATTTPYRAR
jgi:hypothetical protein